MAGYGWSYLVVTRTEQRPAPDGSGGSAAPTVELTASDRSTFQSEDQMLQQLGVTGWELVAVRDAGASVVFYFKRARA
jgi:hypothetical protein